GVVRRYSVGAAPQSGRPRGVPVWTNQPNGLVVLLPRCARPEISAGISLLAHPGTMAELQARSAGAAAPGFFAGRPCARDGRDYQHWRPSHTPRVCEFFDDRSGVPGET